jgi:Ca2+-binding EF-hand superfamily protein
MYIFLVIYHRGPVAAAVFTGLLGGIFGSWMTNRKCTKRFDKDKKDLLQYIKLQDEISKQRDRQWQTEYQKLYKAYSELEKDAVERDYEEFKAPDANNDDMISREEFNTYVKKYLSSFPELSEKDFPKFEEFDLDSDGKVSFDEWQQFLYRQQKAKANKSGFSFSSNSAYDDLLTREESIT